MKNTLVCIFNVYFPSQSSALTQAELVILVERQGEVQFTQEAKGQLSANIKGEGLEVA